MNAKLWKKARWLIFALFLSWGFFPSPGDSATPNTFADKAGYFSFTPPPGWVEKNYPGETVGIVLFTSPDRIATLSLIVIPAPPQCATFEKLFAEKRRIMEKMRQENPKGKYRLAESTICQFKCVILEIEFPGQIIQENYLLVEKGLNVTLGYSAADQAGLEKYRRTALDSFCTIKLKK